MRIHRSSPTTSPRLLIVDDEEFVREAMELYFSTEGFTTFTAAGGAEALERLRGQEIDLAVLDILMPGMDGIQLLRAIKQHDPAIEVVMASGCGTLESAIESMRLGAYDYVTKPILNFEEDLLKVVRKALERRQLVFANQQLALDLRAINSELKTSNGTLKRHLAELETLYEAARLVEDMEDLGAVVELLLQTLQHHAQIPAAALFLLEGGSCVLRGSMGFDDPLPSALAPAWGKPSDEESAAELLALDPSTLAALGAPRTPQSSGERRLSRLPLRAGGHELGFVLVQTAGAVPLPPDRVRLLRLLVAQLASPIALLRTREPAR